MSNFYTNHMYFPSVKYYGSNSPSNEVALDDDYMSNVESYAPWMYQALHGKTSLQKEAIIKSEIATYKDLKKLTPSLEIFYDDRIDKLKYLLEGTNDIELLFPFSNLVKVVFLTLGLAWSVKQVFFED